MGGAAGFTNGWPIWRDDHPLYFHAAVVTRSFLKQSWTTAGYDPTFMAGYPKSLIWPASSTLPEMVMAASGEADPVVVYKVYVFGAAATIPWAVALSCWLWRFRPAATALSVGLFLLYVWTDFPINYAMLGMLPYLLGVPLGLAATGFFVRYVERGGILLWFATALSMSLAVLVHFTTAMIVAPAVLVAYGVAVRKPSEEGAGEARFGVWRHVGVWALPVFVLVTNAFWWAPGVWLRETKGRSDFVFAHPEGLLHRLKQIPLNEPPVQLLFWLLGVAGLFVCVRRSRVGGAALAGFAAAGFFWGYASASVRALDFLQPGRHTYAMYTALALGSASMLVAGLAWVRRRAGLTVGVLLGVCLAAAGGVLFKEPVRFSVQAKYFSGMPFLGSQPTRPFVWILSRVKKHVRPGERLLYEEGGFFPRHVIDPYTSGRFSGLLATTLGIEILGGPYLHVSLATNFTQFGEGRFFGDELTRERFLKYARIYRPAAVLCWSTQARGFCHANPDLVEIKEEVFPFLIARVKGFEGAAVEGKAVVKATPGRLVVERAEGGLDGSVVLRYHSVPCLRSDPPVEWESVYLEDDPVPFIKLPRPPRGAVTFELRFPPGTEGAPAR